MLILKKQADGEKAKSARFEYRDGVAFHVRPLTKDILRELRSQCVKIKMELNPLSRRMEPVEEVDDGKLNDLIADYLLDKWEGVGGGDKRPLPVNLESKKLILNHITLHDFITAASQNLDTTEAEIKNSQTSPASA